MGSHPLVYIRTDGNETIATGHLMRCLTIARSLADRGALPAFIVSDASSSSLLQHMMTPEEISQKVFSIIQLNTNYRDLDQEISIMQGILSSHNVTCLLVDSYFATENYLSALRQICRTAYLDDLQAFDYPADIVINYDIVVNRDFYKKAGLILTGGAYTPLRKQFSLHPYRPWDEVKDIFISTGGTDPFNIAGGLLRRMTDSKSCEKITFHVLTGPLHVHRSELLAMARQDPRIVIHEKIVEMASLMAECDLAFSAGGTTLYELCAVGVPSVSYSMADNQVPGAKAFGEAGLIPWIGDIRNNPDFFGAAMEKLLALIENPQERREQSMRMRMAIDGAGADRIASALTQYTS